MPEGDGTPVQVHLLQRPLGFLDHVDRLGGERLVQLDGVDLIGAGVSSFSHLGGVHFQNVSSWNGYLGRVQSGQFPIERGFATSATERLTRELILQLKLGHVESEYFRNKFGVEILDVFAAPIGTLQAESMLEIDGDDVLVREMEAPKGESSS